MFSNVFPRLFGQFREGQIVRASFAYATSGTKYTADANTFNARGNTLTVSRTSAGKVTVTFPKCRKVEILDFRIANVTPGTVTSNRLVELPPMTDAIAKAGSFNAALYSGFVGTGTPAFAVADPIDGSFLQLALYLGQ